MPAWIDPDGNIHTVQFHRHAEFARDILGDDLRGDHAILALAKLGWLHVGATAFISTKRYCDLPDNQAMALHKLAQIEPGIVAQQIIGYIHE